jgi:hypothetical protein
MLVEENLRAKKDREFRKTLPKLNPTGDPSGNPDDPLREMFESSEDEEEEDDNPGAEGDSNNHNHNHNQADLRIKHKDPNSNLAPAVSDFDN